MSTQQTLTALSRAGSRLRQAFDAYCAAAPSGGSTKTERRELTSAMDAYETAVANHHEALAKQVKKLAATDPRHVQPPSGRHTKGL